MKLHAYVFHNVGPKMFWDYSPAHQHHAHTFQVEADTIERAANLIWILTNVDSADDLRLTHPHLAQYAEQVSAYRARQNRSLSVGDAIVFLERERHVGTLAVASMGFDEVGFDLELLTNVNNEGTRSDSRRAHDEFAQQPRWTPNEA
jgi:hypothetical protein